MNTGTAEEDNHGKFHDRSCQNCFFFYGGLDDDPNPSCTSWCGHPSTGPLLTQEKVRHLFCRTLLFFWRPPSQTTTVSRRFLWFHWVSQRRTKPPSTRSNFTSFTCVFPKSMPNHELCMINHLLVRIPLQGSLRQSRAWKQLGPSLTFVRKLKTWGIWGYLFQTFQTVPVTSSGEETPANSSSLTEKSHYSLFSFNPLGNSFLLKKTQMWFVCHTPWLKNSFIVHWEFLLSGNISYIKDHLEFSLGHSTMSKINSWKKVTKS